MLIKQLRSLCPSCLKVIDAELVESDGKVLMRKACVEHGSFEDIYWGDAEHYRWVTSFTHDLDPISNPITSRKLGCPYDCGLCDEHKSETVLGVVDVTNRCNLRCPICFASAGEEEVYEPSPEQVREMLLNLKRTFPNSCHAFQYSGGEPTLRDDLPELVAIGKELGFNFVMVDTNGIRIANDLDFLKELVDAGVDSLYLQFDGLDDSIYEELRGSKLLRTKLRAIENCREVGMRSIVLVVTLVKGVNDSQLGGIIKFASKNSDVIRCVNVQPLSFSGKASQLEVREKRITIAEFVKLVEEQTKGRIRAEHFYPVPSVLPVSEFVEAVVEQPVVHFSAHPCCGVATYVVVDEDGKDYRAINELVDVDGLLKALRSYAEELRSAKKWGRLKILSVKLGLARRLLRRIPKKELRKLILGFLSNSSYEKLGEFHSRLLMIGCMHFMDAWNYDLERVKRCVIHYALPDGRIVPFCSHNTIHRCY